MKKLLTTIFACALAMTATAQAKSLDEYRAEKGKMCMNAQFMHDYVEALQKAGVSGEELESAADGFTLVNVFYFMDEKMSVDKNHPVVRYYDCNEIGKMKLPLSEQRQTQLAFECAAKDSDIVAMQTSLKKLLSLPMPKGNLCDPVIYGGMMNMTMERLNLKQAREYKAYLEDYLKAPADEALCGMVKSHLEDCTGYIMLKEIDGEK